jgi:hypothetical protein
MANERNKRDTGRKEEVKIFLLSDDRILTISPKKPLRSDKHFWLSSKNIESAYKTQ